MRRAKEKNFENRLKKWLKENGAWYCKYHGDAYSTAGVPDLLVCMRGKFAGVEVKAEDGEPTELQLWTIDRIREAGGKAVVLYPSAFDEFKEWALSDFKGEKPRIMKR